MTEQKYAFSLTLVKDNTLLSIGGMDSSHSLISTIEIFNISSQRQWIKVGNAPFPMAHHCTVALNSLLFVIGGKMDYKKIDDRRYNLKEYRLMVGIDNNNRRVM